jgi:hypothetical protein
MPAGMGSYYPTTPRNLLGFTEDFSNAAWFKSGATITTNAVLAPNGLQTADTVNATGGSTAAVFQTMPSNGGLNVASIYAKAGTKSVIQFSASAAAWGVDARANFDLATGTLGTVDASLTASITAVGDGWYRCSVLRTKSASAGNLIWCLVDNTTAAREASATAGTVHLWGAQLSDSASLDTYVPVYGAAVTSAAYYAPRLDFDSSGVAKGLLVEEARTNLIRYSRTLETTSSYWANLASGTANTITVNNADGPDGAATSASLLTFNTAVPGAGTDYSVWRHSLTTTANGTYTFTVWMKAGTTSSVYLIFNDSAGMRANVQCTLTSNWQRFTVTGTTAASITGIAVDIGGSGFFGHTLAAGTIYVYGAQLEAGSFATSYIPNGATVAGATRAADVASVSTQAFPYSASEGTLVASGTFFGLNKTGSDGLVALTDGTATENIAVFRTSSANNIYYAMRDGNADQATYTVSMSSKPVKVAFAYALNNSNAALNGTARTADTTCTLPTVNEMLIGSIYAKGDYPTNGWIRQITYLPRRISDSELAARTA